MTPKEKAQELVYKIGNIQLYIDLEPRNIEGKIKYFDEDLVKQCALIAVDETLCMLSDLCCDFVGNDIIEKEIAYWKQVKHELNKSE